MSIVQFFIANQIKVSLYTHCDVCRITYATISRYTTSSSGNMNVSLLLLLQLSFHLCTNEPETQNFQLQPAFGVIIFQIKAIRSNYSLIAS